FLEQGARMARLERQQMLDPRGGRAPVEQDEVRAHDREDAPQGGRERRARGAGADLGDRRGDLSGGSDDPLRDVLRAELLDADAMRDLLHEFTAAASGS